MTLFGYTLRKPWVKYVDLNIEDEIYEELKNAVAKNIVAHMYLESIDAELCDDDCEVMDYLRKVAKSE